MGSEVTAKEREYFLSLRDSVVGCDVMVDKLVIKDVQLTAANDDNYFVFEDQIYNTMLCFSRDTEVDNKYFYDIIFKANIYNRLDLACRWRRPSRAARPTPPRLC